MDIQKLKNQPAQEDHTQDSADDANVEPSKPEGVTYQELSEFCEAVLQHIKKDDILATPMNYQIHFEKLLEEKEFAFKESVYNLLEHEVDGGYANYIDLERHMRRSFKSMKKILEVGASLYKNQHFLHDTLTKRLEELNGLDNLVVARNIVHTLSTEVHRLMDITAKQNELLKTVYQESADVINSVDHSTVFDPQFGVYNKNFIVSQIQKEIDRFEQTHRNSTLLVVGLPKEILNVLEDPKILLMIQKNIADMLLKTSRRSDIVAHYGDGIFAILLRHSDLQSSQLVCKRLFELVKTSTVFINNERVTLEINITITDLKDAQNVEAVFGSALQTLQSIEDQKSTCKVVGG